MMSKYLENFTVGCSALGGKIYLGRLSAKDKCCFTSKREAEGEVMKAVVDYLQHAQPEPRKMAKDMSFDGKKTWWRVTVEPIEDPTR